MKKRIAILLSLILLLGTAVWAVAAGSADDPLVSLSYLTGKFSKTMNQEIQDALDKSDKKLINAIENGEDLSAAAPKWTEVRLKQEDVLSGRTGTMVLPLAGEMRVNYESGAVVDVTTGQVIPNGGVLAADHRYLVAEDTEAEFVVTDRTAVLDYQGDVFFASSDAVDYNAMAAALKEMNLFKGSFTGYGEGFDLELAPTRLQALIMFIRVLGEEDEALAWTGSQPFKDIHAGTQAFQYVGYAYEKGYTNGYTETEFRPAGAVNVFQYTEFILRAMGYSSAQNTNIGDALARAQAAGVLTEGETVALQAVKFLRADLVYLSYYALDAALPDGSMTLGALLEEKGVFTGKEWKAAHSLVTSNRM